MRASLLSKVFLAIILFNLAACELTKSLWENAYEEEIRQFLVSENGRYVVFLGKNYHYIFTDNSGVIKKIIDLDKKHLVKIDSEETHIKLDSSNNLSGRISLKTFDLSFSAQELRELEELKFEISKPENAMVGEISLQGKRYLANQDMMSYISVLRETYDIKIYRSATTLRELEQIALTPVTLIADSVLLVHEIIMLPFGE